MIKRILLGIVAVVVIFVIVVLLQPSHFVVERSTTINAPAELVFAHVNDFHKWEEWSPWAKLDPNSKTTFEGAPQGEGAIFRWVGNDQVGEGKMTILESKPNEAIKIKLEFFKPMAGVCDDVFTFKPEGDKTVVDWKMSGENDFIGRAICLFMNMDKMVGGDFEKGLASMKEVVEAEKSGTPKEATTPKEAATVKEEKAEAAASTTDSAKEEKEEPAKDENAKEVETAPARETPAESK